MVDGRSSVLVERLASGLRLQVAVPQRLHHGLSDIPLDLKHITFMSNGFHHFSSVYRLNKVCVCGTCSCALRDSGA